MYKPLPVFGAPPCAVVLHAAPGTDPALLQQAYVNLLGPINKFFSAVRQNQQIGGLPVNRHQMRLPNAYLSYTSNNGLEQVDVTLVVPVTVETSESKPEPKKEKVPNFCVVEFVGIGFTLWEDIEV